MKKLAIIIAAGAVASALFAVEASAIPSPGHEQESVSSLMLAPLKEQTIRVKLADHAQAAKIRGFDLRLIAAGTGSRKPAASPDRISEWKFTCANGAVRAAPSSSSAASSAGAAPAIEVRGPIEVQTPAGFLTFQARPYRDSLIIWPAEGKAGCEVVNQTDIEKYLDGLVNSEFSAKWNEESIAAQVIAARTYAVYQMRQARSAHKRFDVDSTDRDQVYDGSMKEDFRASRSVERTRGVILAAAGSGELIKAFYHSTCGGGTEFPQRVWGSPFAGFKRVVSCPFCSGSPRFKWDYQATASEISRELKQSLLAAGKRPLGWPAWVKGDWRALLREARLSDLILSGRDRRGRVGEVRALWILRGYPELVMTQVTGAKFRESMGSARLKSTLFEVTKSTTLVRNAQPGGAPVVEPLFKFNGRGFGHGVGMCQWGAKTMGERGFKTASILKQYYPDAVMKKLW